MEPKKIFLVGNPNVGKSVLFNALTRTYVTVSNYPGTTVSISKGTITLQEKMMELYDTPGINSLIPMSEDERVTRDLLFQEKDYVVVQVADAKNLQRALPLSLQLKEMGVPFLLVLNMSDEADGLGMMIDTAKLEQLLQVPVVKTVAIRKEGLPQLLQKFCFVIASGAPVKNLAGSGTQFDGKQSRDDNCCYPPVLEEPVQKMTSILQSKKIYFARTLSTMLLAGDKTVLPYVKEKVTPSEKEQIDLCIRNLANTFAEPVGSLFARERAEVANRWIAEVVAKKMQRRWRLGDVLGRWTMHPIWGWVGLLVILEAVYLFVGKWGAGTLVDWFENGLFAGHISPWAIRAVDALLPFSHQHLLEEGVLSASYTMTGVPNAFLLFLHNLLVGPFGQVTMGLSYGMAIVFPIVTTFFIAFSILEDSGYLPRLAVMVNRTFQWMGLNGKAVLPMVLGLGCDTMATMTTRILETRKQRLIVTLLLALAVPCSAQLGILLGMFGTMPAWAFWVWAGIMVGVLFTVGFASSKIISGEKGDFLMELPPLRLPQAGNVAKKTMARLEWYVKEALPLFLLGTLLLFLLDFFRLLSGIQKIAEPLVVHLLGLPKEAANAFLIGFLRRDYGATGFFDMYSHGALTVAQALVALVVITLFVPCIANVFVILKEHGGKVTARMIGFIFPFAFLVGGILNWVMK